MYSKLLDLAVKFDEVSSNILYAGDIRYVSVDESAAMGREIANVHGDQNPYFSDFLVELTGSILDLAGVAEGTPMREHFTGLIWDSATADPSERPRIKTEILSSLGVTMEGNSDVLKGTVSGLMDLMMDVHDMGSEITGIVFPDNLPGENVGLANEDAFRIWYEMGEFHAFDERFFHPLTLRMIDFILDLAGVPAADDVRQPFVDLVMGRWGEGVRTADD